MNQPDILILGAGAVGAFYGSVLASQGASVSAVVRSHYEEVAREGFDIRSPRGDHTFRPRQVLRETGEVKGSPEFLLVCLKVTSGVDRVGQIRPALGPDTKIVLIQNGLEIEAEIAEAFPDHEIISALAYVAVRRAGPRRIEHTASGRLTLGTFPQGVSQGAQTLGTLLEAGGVPCTLTPDIQKARWQKCVWNMLNPISVLAEGAGTLALLNDPKWEGLVRSAMEEVVELAGVVGHPLPPGLVEKTMEGTRRLPDIQTSMAHDYSLGRPLEVEAILGTAVRIGRRHGVPLPTLDSVYERIRLLPGAN
jgi:2-dehydropantoate 2-reductase